MPSISYCWDFCREDRRGGLLATERHVDLLLEYVERDGQLIVLDDTATTARNFLGLSGVDKDPQVTKLAKLLSQPSVSHDEGQLFTMKGFALTGSETFSTDANICDVSCVNRENLAELTDTLSAKGIFPEVSVLDDVDLVSSFVYEGERRLSIHLVNYNHDFDSDAVAVPEIVAVEIRPPRPLSTPIEVNNCTPEKPACSRVESIYAEGILSVRIPQLNIWGVISVTSANKN